MQARTLAMYLVAQVLLLASETRADLVWGVNGHPLVSYPGTSLEQQLEYIKAARLTSYRVDVTGPDKADALGTLIGLGKLRGVQILPILVQQGDLATDSAEALYQRNFLFARTLVARFREDVRTWELGNELENFAIIRPCEKLDNGQVWSCEWGPGEGDSPLEYAGARWAKVSAVLKGLSDGAVVADPGVLKAIGTAGWGHTAAFKRLLDDGVRWDLSVWHWYSGESNLTWALPQIASYGKPIWITEFNRAGGSREGESQQAEDLAAKVAILRRLAPTYGIAAAHVYELLDETYWAPNFEAYMGLIHLEKAGSGTWKAGTLKPAYRALSAAIAAGAPGSSRRMSTFRSLLTGQCIDVARNSMIAGAALIQWPCTNTPNQTFLLVPASKGTVRLKVESSGLCLRPATAKTGASLIQTNCSLDDPQQQFTKVANKVASTVMIKTVDGLCANTRDGSVTSGAPLELATCTPTAGRVFAAPGLF